MRKFNVITLSIALILYAAIVYASSTAVPPESFANEIVQAIRSKNTGQRIAVLHAKSKACINSTTQPYFDWIFTRQFRYQLPPRFKVLSKPLSGSAGTLSDKSVYPVTPTHQLQIDFELSPSSSISIVVLAKHDGKRWREVLPCPTDETLAGAQRSSTENDRQDRRIKTLAANIDDQLRTEILALLNAGQRVDAIRKYASATGEELVIAKGVVELLEKGQ